MHAEQFGCQPYFEEVMNSEKPLLLEQGVRRNWSCLPRLAVNFISRQLNAIDHTQFRSVCMEWRGHTKKREKIPLVILADFNQDGTLKGLSLFDIIRKEAIVCLHRATFLLVRHDYYLGASHGWIFTGQIVVHEECDYPFESHRVLRINLNNPITGSLIILPLLGPETKLGGRVYLLGRPDDLEVYLTVIYYVANEKGADVHFIRYEKGWPDVQWTTFSLEVKPCDVVAVKEHFYASYGGVFHEVILDTGQLDRDRGFLIAGSDSRVRSNSEFFLRYFQNVQGDLYYIFEPFGKESSYPLLKVNLAEWDRTLISPPFYLVFFEVRIIDITTSSMVRRHAEFWGDGMHGWEPVGWITPALN